MAGKIYVAKSSGVIGTKDGLVHLRAGITRVREGHPMLEGREDMFEELEIHYDTEDATARPDDGARNARNDQVAEAQTRDGGPERKTKRAQSPGLTPEGDKAEEDPTTVRDLNPEAADEEDKAAEAQRVSAERDIPLPADDGEADSSKLTDEEQAQQDAAVAQSEELQEEQKEADEAERENEEKAAKLANQPTPRPRRGPRKATGLKSSDPGAPTN